MGTARRFILVSALSLATLGVVALPAGAQVVSVENAKFGAAGVVNANAVAVHSGPGENYYATVRLDKGAPVTVVGVKFDWLKILPPDGSFSYVVKQYIEKGADNTGRVVRANVNVRAGSTLTPLKATIQCQLQTDDKVEILGEAEEYYKIKPPAGAALYVNKQYVDATKVLGPTDEIVKAPTTAGGGTSGVAVKPPAESTSGGAAAPQGTDSTTQPVADGTNPGKPDPNEAAAERVAKVATSQPSVEVTSAIDAYGKAEKDFMAASDQSIDQQPISDLTRAYTALAENPKLPRSMRANAQARLQTLKVREDAQQGVLAARKAMDEGKQRTAALEAERQQLQARLSTNQIMIYSAMGQLSTSTLKLGDTPIYRLTDPSNGRTLVYIRGTDTSLPGMLNQFVGVKGEVVADPQLGVNIITPKSVEPVDANIGPAAAAIHPMPKSVAAGDK